MRVPREPIVAAPCVSFGPTHGHLLFNHSIRLAMILDSGSYRLCRLYNPSLSSDIYYGAWGVVSIVHPCFPSFFPLTRQRHNAPSDYRLECAYFMAEPCLDFCRPLFCVGGLCSLLVGPTGPEITSRAARVLHCRECITTTQDPHLEEAHRVGCSIRSVIPCSHSIARAHCGCRSYIFSQSVGETHPSYRQQQGCV